MLRWRSFIAKCLQARHMQKALLSVARRVRRAALADGRHGDVMQRYEVGLRLREKSPYEQAMDDVQQFQAQQLALLGLSPSRPEAAGEGKARQHLPQIVVKDLDALSESTTSESGLIFDDMIAQFSCRLRFNRHPTLTHCITQVL